MTNPLDPAALLSSLPSWLPTSNKKLNSPHDGLVALFHTALASLGFRLIGVDDSDHDIHDLANKLPEQWSQNGPGSYTLRYRHEQSSQKFVFKVSKLGPRTMVNAIAEESGKAYSFDFSTQDFVSQSFYPHTVSEDDSSPLVHGFISSYRVTDLVSQFKVKIIQNLIPGLQKEGYNDETDQPAATASNSREMPEREPPRIPRFDPYRDSPLRIPGRIPNNPLEIGRRDLDPIPMNPFAPPPLFPDQGDGMFVGPNHPIFGDRRAPRDRPVGPWGGDGFLPPMGAPPGARFDPVGPGFMPGRGNIFDPDNDEFLPPGSNNDMYS